MAERKVAAAIDIGGTKTIVGLVDVSGKILIQQQFATILSDPFVHLKKCAEVLKDSLFHANITQTELKGIGVSAPGLVHSRSGVLMKAPYAGWKRVRIKDWLKDHFDVFRIQVENDVNACALGESLFGIGIDHQNFLWVTVSTGIGSGLVIDGELYRGEHQIAGEIGHIIVDWDHGKKCGCGNKGCLEAHASGTAIARLAREKMHHKGSQSELALFFEQQNLEVTAASTAAAAYNGIEEAIEVYRQAGEAMGKAFSYSVNLLNLGAIIVGGGVSQSFDLLEPGIRKTLRSAVIGETNRKLPIVKTVLGYEAAFLGAASLVFSQSGIN